MSAPPRPGRILYVQYAPPAAFPPLENSAHILAEAGWQVRLLGARMPNLDGMTFRGHPNIDERDFGTVPRGVRHRLHYAAFCLWCAFHSLRWKPDWVYGSDLPGAIPALLAGIVLGRRVLYHEHDAPSPGPRSVFDRIRSAARSVVLGRSSLIVVPGPARVGLLPPEVAASGRVVDVWNGPRAVDLPALRERSPRPLRVVYQGTLVPERIPLLVVDALATLDCDWRLVLVGYETVTHPGYVARLHRRARELGCADKLEIHGLVSTRPELFGVSAGCHVGLSLVPKHSSEVNLATMVRASNKPSDLLGCGLMIVVPDLPDWEEAYVAAGVARSCDPGSAESLAEVFRWCAEHLDEVSAAGARGRKLVLDEWNYDRRFEPVARALVSSIDERPLRSAST